MIKETNSTESKVINLPNHIASQIKKMDKNIRGAHLVNLILKSGETILGVPVLKGNTALINSKYSFKPADIENVK